MSGTVVFQSNTPATPGAGIVVGQDDVSGTAWQYIKIDVGPAGTSRPVSYASGTGVPVSGLGTFQVLGSIQTVGTNQALGTYQPLAGSVHLASGTVQVLGSVQTVGTSQALGTVQPLAGSVHLASTGTLPLGTVQVLGSVQGVGTFQVLGSVQTVGTSQVLGSVQPLAGSVQSFSPHDGAMIGNPFMMAAYGSSGTQAASHDGSVTRLWADLNGRLQVRGTVDTVLGTVQVLGSVQGVGTFQALGSIQTIGTSQILGTASVIGNVASGAADSGNPVKVGGVYNSTLPTLTNGQRGDIQLAPDASQRISPSNVALSGSAASLNADIVASMDVTNYRSLSLALAGFGSATISVQFSNDAGVTWFTARMSNVNTGGVSAGVSAAGFYVVAIPAASLMRIRATSFSSGPITGTAVLSTLPAFTHDVTINANTNSVGVTGSLTIADSVVNGGAAIQSAGYTLGYNGASWDRMRMTNAVVALASAARTATANADVITYSARTFRVILNITVAPNTASTLTMAIRVKDSISSNYVTILTGAAITGSVITASVPNTTTYTVGAGVITTANVSSPEALARTMNVLVTHSNSDSWTYSVSVELGS